MFAKQTAAKCCYMTLAYHKPNTDPPVIPSWDTIAKQSVEPTLTPSMPCPNFAEPSQTHSETANDAILANPNPENEHVGVDEEGLYIDLGLQHPPPPQPQPQPHLPAHKMSVQVLIELHALKVTVMIALFLELFLMMTMKLTLRT